MHKEIFLKQNFAIVYKSSKTNAVLLLETAVDPRLASI